MPFIFFRIILAIGSLVLSYVLAPKVKQPKQEPREHENPKADAGRPIPVVFGTKTISGLNVLYYGEKTTREYRV